MMIVQTTNPLPLQSVQPEVRAFGPAPARAVGVQAAPAPAVPVSPEALKQAVAVINQALQQANRNFQFSVDTDTKQTVVKLIDTSTGEMIRQFPSETTLAISRDIDSLQQGLLIRQQA